jgi:hypothetical protein
MMLRDWCTALGAVWLGTVSLQAPFAHLHPGDPEHHHASGLAHAHLKLAPHHDAVGDLEIEPHDDDAEVAVGLEWLPVAQQRFAIAYAETPVAFSLEPLQLSAGAAPEYTPRSHDPPLSRLLPPRAPPL